MGVSGSSFHIRAFHPSYIGLAAGVRRPVRKRTCCLYLARRRGVACLQTVAKRGAAFFIMGVAKSWTAHSTTLTRWLCGFLDGLEWVVVVKETWGIPATTRLAKNRDDNGSFRASHDPTWPIDLLPMTHGSLAVKYLFYDIFSKSISQGCNQYWVSIKHLKSTAYNRLPKNIPSENLTRTTSNQE